MILTCPACQKKYLVPDRAIGAEGRQVRCASCRHSWFESPRELLLTPDEVQPISASRVEPSADEVAPAPAPAAAPVHSEPVPPSWTGPASGHAAEVEESEPVDYDAYAPGPPFRQRRRGARRWTIAAFLASAVLLGGIGAVYYFGSPGLVASLMARVGIQIGDTDTPLIIQFSSDRGPKEGMPATAPYVTIHGQIINPTDRPQRVPDIIAELLDNHKRVVYSWVFTPQRRTIDAKKTLPIDDTAVNIPMSARETRLTFSGVDPR